MKKRKAEQVSMLMDDELNGAAMRDIIQEMRQDDYLKHCWESYHLIGTALRKKLSAHYQPDLVTRISSALQNEPSYFQAPASIAQETTKVVARQPRYRSWGYALAASVTALAVVGVMQSSRQAEFSRGAPVVVAAVSNTQQQVARKERTEASAQLASLAPATGSSTAQLTSTRQTADKPVVYASVTISPLTPVSNTSYRGTNEGKLSYPEEAANLYDYLVNYHKYARTGTLQDGMYPAVQLVGYNPQ